MAIKIPEGGLGRRELRFSKMRSGGQEKEGDGGNRRWRGADGGSVPSVLPELFQPLVPWWSKSIHYTVAIRNTQESEDKKKTVDWGGGGY